MDGKLSSRQIERLKPKEKRYTIADGSGLALRVHPSGVKSWVLRYSRQGRVKDISLGHWPEVSLMAARARARTEKKSLGIKPPDGFTLNDAFRLWKGLKKGKIVSYEAEKRMIESYLIAELGNRQLDELTAPAVIEHMKKIEKRGIQATVKRLIMRLREMLNLAVCAGYIDANPCASVSKLFAPPKVTPMLSVAWTQLPEVMQIVKDSDAPERTKRLFKIQLLLMLRPNEAAGLKWAWFNADRTVLTIPSECMKNGKDHRVPVPAYAAQILAAQKKMTGRSKFVFPSRIAGQAVSSQTVAKFLAKTPLRGRLVAHGLRSLARSWLADHAAPYEVAELCLAHTVGSQVSRAYQRSDMIEKRRQFMDAWSLFVSRCA